MPLTLLQDRASDDPRGALHEPLVGRRVAILGYGNQGRAHALNLRDSGVSVVVGSDPHRNGAKVASADGFSVLALREAAEDAELIVLALPDTAHASVWEQQLAPVVRRGQSLGFVHGLSVRFGRVVVPEGIGLVLVAPKGPGQTLRDRYLEGRGIPCLYAVEQESDASAARSDAETLAIAWAAGLGCGRSAIVRTTFADEAETDLFGEQAVLCGGAMALAQASYETLVEAGYAPELAYIECIHELKQVVDLLFERGFAGMRAAISPAAEFGGFSAGEHLVDETIRRRLRELLAAVRDGSFVSRMESDFESGGDWIENRRRNADRMEIEAAGRVVRSWMPWLNHAVEESTERDATQ